MNPPGPFLNYCVSLPSRYLLPTHATLPALTDKTCHLHPSYHVSTTTRCIVAAATWPARSVVARRLPDSPTRAVLFHFVSGLSTNEFSKQTHCMIGSNTFFLKQNRPKRKSQYDMTCYALLCSAAMVHQLLWFVKRVKRVMTLSPCATIAEFRSVIPFPSLMALFS